MPQYLNIDDYRSLQSRIGELIVETSVPALCDVPQVQVRTFVIKRNKLTAVTLTDVDGPA